MNTRARECSNCKKQKKYEDMETTFSIINGKYKINFWCDGICASKILVKDALV